MSDVVKVRSSRPKIRVVRADAARYDLVARRISDSGEHTVSSGAGSEELDQLTPRQGKGSYEERCREEYNRGLAEGERRSASVLRAEYEERLAAEKQRLDTMISGIRQQCHEFFQSSEDAVLKFAFGVAERIIRKEVCQDREIVLHQIRESVRRVLGVERLTIRVHPEDLAAVREQKSMIQANGDSIREIVVEGDQSLERGDCVLESDLGNIDARVSTQMKQIENVFFESKVVS